MMQSLRKKGYVGRATLMGFLTLGLAGCGVGGPRILSYETNQHADGEIWVFDTSVRNESPEQGNDERLLDPAYDWSRDPETSLSPYEFIPDRKYRDALFLVLSNAKQEVLMLQLEFYSDRGDPAKVADRLKSLASSGVTVRVLAEADVDGNNATIETLKAAGIDARLDNSKISLHTKLVLVDGRVALVGSTNISNASLLYNHEANYLITEPDAVNAIRQYALDVLQNENRQYKIDFIGSGDVLPFSDGQYLEVVMPYIERAQDKVFLVMYDFNTSVSSAYALAAKLIEAHKRGADVRVFLERSSFDEKLNQRNKEAMSLLCKGGVPTKLDSTDVTTHAKLMITEEAVVVYSGNFNRAGLEENHELGVVVPYDAVAVSYFEALFQGGGPPCSL